MSINDKSRKFSQIDANSAYLIQTKNGVPFRSGDVDPVLFVAGEGDKYKFMLRSLYINKDNQLNVLLMSCSDIKTPTFSVQIGIQDATRATIHATESLLCPHGTVMSRDEHFHYSLLIENSILNLLSFVTLKLIIGGTPVPFHIWSANTSDFITESNKSVFVVSRNRMILL